MKTFWQIFGIARTEFRFGLRRGGPVVIPALIGLLVAAGILLNPLANLSISKNELNRLLQDPVGLENIIQSGWTVESFKQFVAQGMADVTVFSTMMAWPILLLTSLLLLPAATAVTLPSDRKFGVGELLRSMPLNAGSYLAGKILGVSFTVLLVSLIPLGLFFGVLEVIFLDTYQVGIPANAVQFFLKFALLDGLPILVWGLTIGILAGTPFRSRRSAVFPGLTAGVLSILLWLVVFKTPAIPFSQIDLALYYLLRNYHSVFYETVTKMTGDQIPGLLGANAPLVGFGKVLIMYLAVFVILFVLAGLARLWLLWKENF
jgi:ABC-type Na+ efflux pump permease subunit